MSRERPDASDTNVHDWQLERYLLDELEAEEYDAVREALERDLGLRARLATLTRSNREILARHPPRVAAAAIRAQASTAPEQVGKRPGTYFGGRPALIAAFSLVAMAAGILLVGPRWHDERTPDVTRIKGLDPHLLLYRKTAGVEFEPLPPGASARAGDVVQIAYQAAGRRYGVIVSMDGRGLVTRHLPLAGTEAAELETGHARPLAEAYELDDAPEFERFHFVATEDPFPVETVLSAVRQSRVAADREGARLVLPSSFDQFTYVLRKEPSP